MTAQTQSQINQITSKVEPILKKYPIRKAGLFGSVTRGDSTKDSDIDMLIDITPNSGISLLDYVRIKLELEDALGKKVDLVRYNTIKPALVDQIIPYEVRIYEANS
jgi:hypothetical protein